MVTIRTERLNVFPLTARQLALLVTSLPDLERELDLTYKGQPIEGHLLDVMKQQSEVTATLSDSEVVWHTFWMVMRKFDRQVVDSISLKGGPNADGEVEIGYGLSKEFEKSGYMQETVTAMCNWLKKQPGVQSVIAETELDNVPSQRVLSRCGFKSYREDFESKWWRI